jgi:hypothetical protein
VHFPQTFHAIALSLCSIGTCVPMRIPFRADDMSHTAKAADEQGACPATVARASARRATPKSMCGLVGPCGNERVTYQYDHANAIARTI